MTPRLTLGVFVACCCALPWSRAEKLVTVRSVVDWAYGNKRAAQNPPPVETYVFAQGRYLNEIPMDRYLERMDFRTIATTIARDLKPRGYEPAKDYARADLVLVVHWGVTQGNDSAASMLLPNYDVLQTTLNAAADARAIADDPIARERLATLDQPGVLETLMAAEQTARQESSAAMLAQGRNETQRTSNAVLLGLQVAMAEAGDAPFGSALDDTLRLMVNEERYFIIVMAYDAAALREGRKKRLWTTRASIRAAGVNFAIALDRMSGSAGAFHGLPQNSLAMEVSKDRLNRPVKEGNVNIGEIKVLGETPPTAARSGKR